MHSWTGLIDVLGCVTHAAALLPRTLLTLMLLKTEREQRLAGTEEVPLPWRAPGLGRSPIVTGATSPGRAKAVAASRSQVLRDSGASGFSGGSQSATRRLSKRVSAQKFL